MCMQRPKSASRKLAESQKRGVAQLPGIGQFTFNPATHHPFCPSADARCVLTSDHSIAEVTYDANASQFRTASMKVLNSTEIPHDPATAGFYPLSPDALRTIDAIEYITDHLRHDEEHKMVGGFDDNEKSTFQNRHSPRNWRRKRLVDFTFLRNRELCKGCFSTYRLFSSNIIPICIHLFHFHPIQMYCVQD